MKRLLFVIVVMAALALCACATTGPQPATASASPNASPSATVVSTVEMEQAVIALEKKGWELYKNKQEEEYRKSMAPGCRIVDASGIKNADEEISVMKINDIRSYTLSEMKVNFPIRDTAILTYKAAVDSNFKGKHNNFVYNITAVWVNIGGEWKAAAYTEAKADPQPRK